MKQWPDTPAELHDMLTTILEGIGAAARANDPEVSPIRVSFFPPSSALRPSDRHPPSALPIVIRPSQGRAQLDI